jgi:preprotein translocase subunit SecE
MSTEGVKPESRLPKTGSVPVPKIKKGVGVFLKEALAEMKKVVWPTKRESTRLTYVVFAVCGMVIVFLFGLSIIIEMIFGQLIRKGA